MYIFSWSKKRVQVNVGTYIYIHIYTHKYIYIYNQNRIEERIRIEQNRIEQNKNQNRRKRTRKTGFLVVDGIDYQNLNYADGLIDLNNNSDQLNRSRFQEIFHLQFKFTLDNSRHVSSFVLVRNFLDRIGTFGKLTRFFREFSDNVSCCGILLTCFGLSFSLQLQQKYSLC